MTKDTATQTANLMTLDELDFSTASGRIFKSPFNHPTKGPACGVVLHIIGDESEAVSAFETELSDEQRRAAAIRAVAQAEQAMLTGKPAEPVFRPTQDDVADIHRRAAARLVGWDGIAEPYSKEAALRLVSRNETLRKQVMSDAGKVANFL